MDNDKFIELQERLGADFEKVLHDNIWNLMEGSATCTSADTPSPLSIEKLKEFADMLDRTPRFMTEKEFYEIHGDMSGVLLNSEDFEEMLLKSNFPVTVPRYFQKSPFVQPGEVIIFSQNEQVEKGFIIKGK